MASKELVGFLQTNALQKDAREGIKFIILEALRDCRYCLSNISVFGGKLVWDKLNALESLILAFTTTTKKTDNEEDNLNFYLSKPSALKRLDDKYLTDIKRAFNTGNFSDPGFEAYLHEKFRILVRLLVQRRIVSLETELIEVW